MYIQYNPIIGYLYYIVIFYFIMLILIELIHTYKFNYIIIISIKYYIEYDDYI